MTSEPEVFAFTPAINKRSQYPYFAYIVIGSCKYGLADPMAFGFQCALRAFTLNINMRVNKVSRYRTHVNGRWEYGITKWKVTKYSLNNDQNKTKRQEGYDTNSSVALSVFIHFSSPPFKSRV